MAKYRKIDPKIWNDEKFRTATLSCQHLFVFILTHPHMAPVGAMRTTPAGLREELDWDTKGFPEAFPEAFKEGCDKGFWKYDPGAKFLLVPKFLRYNGPESPNVVKSWIGCWPDLPECDLKHKLFHNLKALLKGYGEAYQKAFREAFKEAFAEGYGESGAGAGAGTGAGVKPPGPSATNPDPDPEPEREPLKLEGGDAEKPPSPDDDVFESLWALRPRRAGNDPKHDARQAFNARMKQGESVQEIRDGLRRYVRFCTATGKLNTEKVMQFRTFMGPSKPWQQPWTLPRQGAAISHENDDAIARALGEVESEEDIPL